MSARSTISHAAATPDAIAALRPALLRFARLQLRDDAQAEDAVSETLLAMLEKPQSFAGASALKTYAIGILKHKIIDHLRRQTRQAVVVIDDDQDWVDSLFQADGHWCDPPVDWGNPVEHFERRQFFEVLDACVDNLSAQQARLFMMREWLELETTEICRELRISSSNCFVLLHRARLQLRECLQIKWFAGSGQ